VAQRALFGRMGEVAGEYLRKGSQGLCRRRLAHAQVAGQAGQRPLHDGNRGQRMQMLGSRVAAAVRRRAPRAAKPASRARHGNSLSR